MDVILAVQTEDSDQPNVHEFRLDSTELVWLPLVGDRVQLPGMTDSVEITARDFIYEEPNILRIWLSYDINA